MKKLLYIFFCLLMVISSCKQKTPAEKALEGLQESVDDAGEEIKENTKDANEKADKKAKKKKKSLKDIKIKL